MSERMIHYLGGPADGHVAILQEDHHPFAISMRTDTDGYYGIIYDVAGQVIGSNYTLTDKDVIARWRQRSHSHDFMNGDIVIVKATGRLARAFAPTTQIDADGTGTDGWTIDLDGKLAFVKADEIRIAVSNELLSDPLT